MGALWYSPILSSLRGCEQVTCPFACLLAVWLACLPACLEQKVFVTPTYCSHCSLFYCTCCLSFRLDILWSCLCNYGQYHSILADLHERIWQPNWVFDRLSRMGLSPRRQAAPFTRMHRDSKWFQEECKRSPCPRVQKWKTLFTTRSDL